MEKSFVVPVTVARHMAVLELECDRVEPPQWLRIRMHLNGRDLPMERVWVLGGEPMEWASAQDVLGWILRNVHAAIATSVGVHDRLEENGS